MEVRNKCFPSSGTRFKKRILWISNQKKSDEIIEVDNLIYIFCNKDSNYEDTVLELEEIDEVSHKFIDLS